MIDPTKVLKGRSLEIWHAQIQEIGYRLLQAELPLLMQYCEAMESWEQASRMVRDTTSVAQETGPGNSRRIIVNPWVNVREQAARRMAELSRQLGISPDKRLNGDPSFEEIQAGIQPSIDDLQQMADAEDAAAAEAAALEQGRL